MKAIVCKTYGPPENLVLEEIDDPVAAENEAVVQIYSASLNFPDGLQIQGKYQFQPPMPFTPGSEVGGIITSVGTGTQGFAVGDRVMATPGIGG
ncbi:MAG: alcohol dehydrogenase catalytic domain-containing protein, partial [Gammaproteobacteria bacterium]